MQGLTHSFRVGEIEGYLITGEDDAGSLKRVFLHVSKQGSVLRGVFECWATAISLGLQHGVPLELYVEQYVGLKFEPNGITDDPEAKHVTSVSDYVFKLLAREYLSESACRRLGATT